MPDPTKPMSDGPPDRERAAIEAAAKARHDSLAHHGDRLGSWEAWGFKEDDLFEAGVVIAAYNAALQEPEGQASDPRAQSEAKQGSENSNSPSLLASSRAPKPADQKPGFHETMDREAVEPPERVVPQPGEERPPWAVPHPDLVLIHKVCEAQGVIPTPDVFRAIKAALVQDRSERVVPQDGEDAIERAARFDPEAAANARAKAPNLDPYRRPPVPQDEERCPKCGYYLVPSLTSICTKCGWTRPAPAPVPQDEERHRWRVGRKVGRTIYRQLLEHPNDGDELVGVMDSVALAQEAVEAHNAALSTHPSAPEDEKPDVS